MEVPDFYLALAAPAGEPMPRTAVGNLVEEVVRREYPGLACLEARVEEHEQSGLQEQQIDRVSEVVDRAPVADLDPGVHHVLEEIPGLLH